jgi:hypothetical protein
MNAGDNLNAWLAFSRPSASGWLLLESLEAPAGR